MQELIPEFSNPESSQKVRGDLREYATAQSFSPEEIGNLVDSRQIHVLYKAMKYDELQNADVKTKKIVSLKITDDSSHDAAHLPELVEQASQKGTVVKVLADGAYDTKDDFSYLYHEGIIPGIKTRLTINS